jgi:hypothetical protein
MNSLRKFSGFDRRRRVSSGLQPPQQNFLSKPIPPRARSENPEGLDRGIEERVVREPLLRRWTESFP